MKNCETKLLIGSIVCCFLSMFLSGCIEMFAGGGTGGTGYVSTGSISSFDSIVVNGRELTTDRAIVIVEGEIIGMGDDVVKKNLEIGMVVNVKGRLGTGGSVGRATQVVYNDNLEGPVDRISDLSLSSKEIVVLGQTVIINVVTKFKAIAFDTIAQGDVVEISGHFDDKGRIWATFIEKKGAFRPNSVFEVRGYIAALNVGSETFRINNLIVDYSLADTTGLPFGKPANRLFVEVTGTLDDSRNRMQASVVGLGDPFEIENEDQIEIAGFVTGAVSGFEFTVGNQKVKVDQATVYIDGSRDDLVPGVKLEAEGRLSGGTLFAKEIEFWKPDQIEVEGSVTHLISESEFTVDEQTVKTVPGTIFEGGTPKDIAIGVRLEVKGVPTDIDRSVLIADKVSFEDEI